MRRVLAGALLGALALPQALSAQDDRPPGTLLTFDLSQRLAYDDNLGLEPGGEDDTLQAVTGLAFSLVTATRVQSLELAADATLRVVDGPREAGTSFDGPDLSFGYDRQAANASLSVNGAFSRRDVAFLRDLDDFVNEDGFLELPDDFDDLEGTGLRQSASLDASLSLRRRSRAGLTLSAGLTDLRYLDVTSDELADSRRVRVGADLRLALSRAAEADLGVGYSLFDEEGDDEGDADERGTLTFDAGVTVARPAGTVSADLGLVETEDGTRASLSFGRSLDLPLGGISGELGVTRDASGGLNLTGDLAVARDLPRGGLSLALGQSVGQDSDDDERRVTTVSASYRRDLTPLASLSLDARYANSRATDAGTDSSSDVESLSLGASASYALTRDWSLQLGVEREVRDEEDEGRADNNSVFLALSRSFVGTF